MKLGRAANKKLEMEERIYQASMTLFQEKGFVQTTLQEICELANVSKGTIFNYFSSKEDILAKFGQNQIRILRSFANQLPSSMDTKGKIIAVLMEDIKCVKESEVYAGITLKGISEGGNKVYQLESKNRQDLSEIYENILKPAQKSDCELNSHLVAELIVTIYFHVLEKHFNRNESMEELEKYILHSVDILFNGISEFLNE